MLQARTSSRRTVNVALSTSPGIRKISFTGSTDVGISISQQAAATVKRVTMELGGNDPAIVLDDADIAVTARGIVGSAFRNAGQVCMAVKRVYVPRSRSRALAEAIAAEASRHVLGHGIADGTTMGPMHNESQLKLVYGLVDSAVGAGARIITGGNSGCDLPGSFSPTVVIDAEPGMDLVEQEQFGAALPIVAYDDLDATIAGLNAGEFGLGASVWSPDQERAYATASRIEAGTVWSRPAHRGGAGCPVRRLEGLRRRPRTRPLGAGGIPGNPRHQCPPPFLIPHQPCEGLLVSVELITLGTAAGPAIRGPENGISSALVVGDAFYVVDFGLGCSRAAHEAGLRGKDFAAGFVTHLHSDHVVELPGFLLWNWATRWRASPDRCPWWARARITPATAARGLQAPANWSRTR